MKNITKSLVLCASVALGSQPALAEEEYTFTQPEQPQQSGFRDVTLGLAGGTMPEYSGANDNTSVVLPVLAGQYFFDNRNSVGYSPLDGLNYSFRATQKLYLGANADLRRGRDSSDDTFLAGMPDIDTAVEVGPWLKIKDGNFTLATRLSFDASGAHEGFVGEISGNYTVPFSPQLKGYIGVSTLYGSDEYMSTYYGVTAAQATASRTRFAPDAGFSEASVSCGLSYFMNRNWFLRGDLRFTRLLGDAADSPISREDNQWRSFVTVGYRF